MAAPISTDNKQRGQTSYRKGLELEQRFCVFMKQELGYRETNIRRTMSSVKESRGNQVDIIGVKSSRDGIILRRIVLFYAFCCLFSFYGAVKIHDYIMFASGVFFEVVGLVAFTISYKRDIEHAWVECKNRDTNKATLAQVREMLDKCQDYKKTRKKRYYFTTMYFVSAAGYTESAFNEAKSKEVICYIVENGIFVKATDWNI